jgi:hypothetical protein
MPCKKRSRTDCWADAWHAGEMAKAVKMGTFMLDTKMRPNDGITRQEAFTVLARAFKLVGEGEPKVLDRFSDKGDIANWALASLAGMTAEGYIQGSDGKLQPQANITRAEFATIMNNLVKQYIDSAEEVNEVADGNVIIRVPGVTLKDVTVKGDLIIADGVGDGDVTLDNVTVQGRTVVRGGGVDSIIIKGNSDVGKVIVAKVDGEIRIYVEGGAEVEIIYVDDGSDDVIVEGTIGELEVAGDNVTVIARNAVLGRAEISGDSSAIVVGDGSTLRDGAISGRESKIIAEEGAVVEKVTVTGANATVEGDGTVKEVDVGAGVDGTEVGGTPVEGGQTVDGSGEPVTPPSRPSGPPALPKEPGIFTVTFDITVVDPQGNLVPAEGVEIEVAKISWNESGNPTIEKQDPKEDGTYKLDATSYHQYKIRKENYTEVEGALWGEDTHVRLTLVKVQLLGESYYATGNLLEFTIEGLKHSEPARVGMPIRIELGHCGHQYQWASSKLVLTEGMVGNDNERHFVGTTGDGGVLTVKGNVGENLPYGAVCITLPDYGYSIDNAIKLQRNDESLPDRDVYVGDPLLLPTEAVETAEASKLYSDIDTAECLLGALDGVPNDRYEQADKENLVTRVQTLWLDLAASAKGAFDDTVNWDTIIRAVHIYDRAKESGANSAGGEIQTSFDTLTTAYAEIEELDLSGQTESVYDISTGALQPFTGLKTLNLSNTGIEELGGLVGLTNLENLNVSDNEITDLGALVGMDDLTTLDISGTSLTELNLFWAGPAARFANLTTLNAKNITTLESIAGLVEVANAAGFNADGITWDLSGSVLASDPDNHIGMIEAKVAEKQGTFKPPLLAGITASKLAKGRYVANEPLSFTIRGLNPSEEVTMSMMIYSEGPYYNIEPADLINSMTRINPEGKTEWLGIADEYGKLTVAGIVQSDLPYGELHIILPQYGGSINNSIPLQDNNGNNVHVGEQAD